MGSPEMEERLREAACFGDLDGVKELLSRGVNVNAQHDINGWTALHWAAKRNHLNIVNLLCNHGADKNVPTNKGEVAAQLTSEGVIKVLLNAMKGSPQTKQIKKEDPLPITPNYIRNPPLNYEVEIPSEKGVPEKRPRTAKFAQEESKQPQRRVSHNNAPQPVVISAQSYDPQEIILKIRIANSSDTDFIEMELPNTALTMEYLIVLGCEELEISPDTVEKVRKLPNTRLRRDKEVERLQNYQELEFVLKGPQVEEGMGSVVNGVDPMEDERSDIVTPKNGTEPQKQDDGVEAEGQDESMTA